MAAAGLSLSGYFVGYPCRSEACRRFGCCFIAEGELEKIKEYAESIGKSFNGYINDLIVSDMEKNGVELRSSHADEQATAE